MSVVKILPGLSAQSSVAYVLYGRGSENARHVREGTTRAAAYACSMDSPAEFIERASALAMSNGRKNEVYNLIQSWSADEFDVTRPEDLEQVRDEAVKLAEAAYCADYLVAVHADASGGHAHAHVVVINHDNLTNKALKKNTSWTRGLRQLNDELMREGGHQVLPSPAAPKPEWEIRREQFVTGGFEQTLGDKVADALMDPRSINREGFEQALAERGVTLAETKRDGWSYKMRRADNNKLGRKKASALCDEFTKQGVQPVFNFHRANAERISRECAEELREPADFGTVEYLDLTARRHRGTVDDSHDRSQRVDGVREGDGRTALEESDRVDLAAARAALEAAARRRNEEQDRRDREDARRRRLAAEQQRSREAARRQQRDALRRRRALDDDADREAARDDGPEFG